MEEGQLIQLTDGASGGRNYAEGWWEGAPAHPFSSGTPSFLWVRFASPGRRAPGNGCPSAGATLTYRSISRRHRFGREEGHIPEQLRKPPLVLTPARRASFC